MSAEISGPRTSFWGRFSVRHVTHRQKSFRDNFQVFVQTINLRAKFASDFSQCCWCRTAFRWGPKLMVRRISFRFSQLIGAPFFPFRVGAFSGSPTAGIVSRISILVPRGKCRCLKVCVFHLPSRVAWLERKAKHFKFAY